MKSRIHAWLGLALLALNFSGVAWAAECIESGTHPVETVTLTAGTQWTEDIYSRERYVDDKELCSIKMMNSSYGTSWCGYSIANHRAFTCTDDACQRGIRLYKDGLFCFPVWGPDLGSDDARANYVIAYIYKPVTKVPLSVNRVGTGDVQVDGTALVFDGNGNGSKSVVQGKTVSLEAVETPGTGYVFKRWEVPSTSAGKIVSTDGRTFPIRDDKTISVKLPSTAATIRAIFERTDRTLTMLNDGNGTTTPAGDVTLSEGVWQNILAIPSSGAVTFSYWQIVSGTVEIANSTAISTQARLTNGNATIKAIFLPNPTYRLTVLNDGRGTTNPSTPPGTYILVQGGQPIPISASSEREFNSWVVESGEAVIANPTSPNTTVTLTGIDVNYATIKATFKPFEFRLWVFNDGNGSTTPSDMVTVPEGFTQSVTAHSPREGYRFLNWTLTSGTATIANPNSATSSVTPTSDATVFANHQRTYLIYLRPEGNGTIAPAGPLEAVEGETFSITGTPGNGSHFLRWEIAWGNVSVSDPNSASTTISLASLGNAQLVAVFAPTVYELSGVVRTSFSAAGIEGAVVTMTGSDGKAFSTQTSANGSYSFPALPPGTYSRVITHSCYETLTETVVVTESGFEQRYMDRALVVSATKRRIQVGESTDLSMGNCAEITDATWTTDVGGAEERILPGRNVSVSFTNAGFKDVRAVARYSDGQQLTSDNVDYIEVLACTPGRPIITLTSAAGEKVIDRCPSGLGSEPVTFTADLILGRCSSADPTSYQWFHNGIVVGTGTTITRNITYTPTTHTIRVVATRNGETFSAEKKVRLAECELGPDRKPKVNITINLEKEIDDVTREPIEGTVVQDDDGSLIVKGDAHFDPECDCKHEVTFEKWKLQWRNSQGQLQTREYTDENADIALDQGFINYTLIAVGHVRDVEPGKEKDLGLVQLPRPIQVKPKIPLPKLGTCNNSPFYCEHFYSDAFPNTPLDLHKPTLELEASGRGFSGSSDAGKYAFAAVSGDFTLAVRIKTNPGQAGILIRSSLLISDRSLFLSRAGGNVAVTHREYFAQDVLTHDLAPSTRTCLRVRRSGEQLSLFAAIPTGTTCPDPLNESLWGTPVEGGIGLNLSAWQGRVYLGLAAAGSPGNQAEFDNIFLQGEPVLTEPALIANTLFPDGNMIRNWGFESDAPAFTDAGKFDLRRPGTTAEPAYTGRHFARFSNKSAGDLVKALEPISLDITNSGRPVVAFQFKFRIRQGQALGLRPSLVFVERDGTITSPELLPVMTTTNFQDWFEYSHVVNLAEIPNAFNYQYFHFHLIDAAGVIASNQHLDVDEVLVSPIFRSVESRNKPINTFTFADGMGQDFQTVQVGEKEDIVSARLLDDEGRPQRTLPIFGGKESYNPAEFHGLRKNPLAAAQAYFEDAGIDDKRRVTDDFLDIKPKWSDFREGAGTVVLEASPMNRALETWGRSPTTYQDFLFSYSASEDKSMAIKTTFLGAKGNSNKSEEYYNAYGYSVRTLAYANGSGLGPTPDVSAFVTEQEKDILGRVWKATSPRSTPTNPIERLNTYNTLDQAIATQDPDAGITRSFYDRRGLLRFFQDANKAAENQFLANVYDDFGRLTNVYTVEGTATFDQEHADMHRYPDGEYNTMVRIRHVYDRAPPEAPAEVAPEMANLKGRLAMTTAYTSFGAVVSYYSYDERGQVKTAWKEVLGLPLHRTDFVYNLAGKMAKKSVSGKRPDGNPFTKSEAFAYDEFNQLHTIHDGTTQNMNREIARFEYWPDGKTRYMDFGPGLNQGMSFAYDESERLIKLRHEVRDMSAAKYVPSNVYEQGIGYDRYGNIVSQEYRLGNIVNPFRGVKYAYDERNRLADVDHGSSNVSYGAIDYSLSSKYNSNYIYDEDGSITHAVRGKENVVDESDYAAYEYYPGTHRVKRVIGAISPDGHDRSHAENYVYDGNGNIILDRATLRAYEYDYRNLPIRVTHCVSLEENKCLVSDRAYIMSYDADGKRVAKIRLH